MCLFLISPHRNGCFGNLSRVGSFSNFLFVQCKSHFDCMFTFESW